MRRLCLLAAMVCSASCGSASLDLVFSVPQPYGDAIKQVDLRIYQPRAASAFDCDALAFGQVEDGVLRGSLVQEVSVTNEGVLALAQIERQGDKVVFAQGLDAQDRPVVRGCVQVAGIEEGATITIPGEPVAKVSLIDAPSLSKTLGESLDAPVALGVSDIAGRPLPVVPVLWAVEGVAGVASRGEAVTDSAGEVSIRPALPARPGPLLLTAQVRWAEPGPPLATGFMAPPHEALTLAGRVLDYRSGEIGPTGQPGLVALVEASTLGQVQVVFVYRDAGQLVQTLSPPMADDGARLGLFNFQRARDRAVVVSRSAWVEVAPDGILTPRDYTTPVAAIGAQPNAVLATGSCASAPDEPRLLVTYSANAVGFFDLEANLVGGFGQRLEVLASGCVDDQDGAPVRTLVINGGDQVGLAVVAEPQPEIYVTRSWVAVGSGAAFSRPVGETGRLLLGTQLNVNDFVVSRASWYRDGPATELVMQGLDSPPDVPSVNQGGDFDGDGTLDIVSLYRTQVNSMSDVQWHLWGVWGRTFQGERMAGTFDLIGAERANPTIMSLDMDGDGVDDIVVAERADPTLSVQTQTRIEVYSMGLALQ